jgi:UDP-2,3-diacylglucosamine pyrophosphatase LpxH
MSTEKCLDRLLASSDRIDFDENSKIILFSDCHRGDNSWADDFAPNESLLDYALYECNKNGFTFIEVGDGDELWENSFRDIWIAHYHIFDRMLKFYDPDPAKNRLHLIYGNHDIEKRKPDFLKKTFGQVFMHHYDRDPSSGPQFEGLKFREALVLHNKESGREFLIAHGHQGDLLCDSLWWVSKYIVRKIWKPIQQIFGVKDPTSPAESERKQDEIDATVKKWLESHAKENTGLIIGHTHRPWCARVKEVPYFNTGSCVHPRCITGIKIEKNQICLIKWGVTAEEGGRLIVKRTILDGPVPAL